MAERIEQLRHDGLTFDVFDEGPLKGEVVVLLHGFPERSTTWKRVAPLLHAQGYRTVAMDQRGYSPGARPRGRRHYRIRTVADDAAALAERVGAPVHLVGHDWGAIAAWAAAMFRPEVFRTLTALSVPHPMAFLAAGVTSSQLLRSWYIGLFQVPGLAERLARRPGGRFDQQLLATGMTEEEVARFRREMVDDGALPTALAWYRAMVLLDRQLLGRKVTVPTTLVWSDGDTALARRGAETTHRWVDAPYELVVLEGATHWLPTQEPQAVADAVLARVRG